MERLTIKNWRNLDPWETCGQDNYCKRGCHEQGGCTKGCIVPRIYAHLAVYEDTGLAPEEIKELRELCTDEVAELARTLYKAMESGKLDHLRDILQADQDGRIPPCKRGDVVYCIRHNPCIGYYVKTLTVCTVTIWGPGRFSVFTTKEDELGKTVFLTREEAEAALAQKGGEG